MLSASKKRKTVKRKNGLRYFPRKKRAYGAAPPAERRKVPSYSIAPLRIKQSLAQPRIYEKLRNCYGVDKSSTAGGICHFAFRLNDLFDGFVTGAANTQPLGYDQITPDMYEKYRVYKGQYRGYLRLQSTAGQDCLCIMWLSRDNTAPGSGRIAASQPGAVVRSLSVTAGGDDSMKSFKGNFNVQNFIPKDEMGWTAYNASPTNILYLNFYFCGVSLGVLASSTTITYIYCELFQEAEFGMKASDVIPVS